jgi:hypothetical protein
MSESEIRRMLETIYGENGLLVAVAKIQGGVDTLKWMVGIGLLVVGLIISYLGYVATSHSTHAILLSDRPVVTASSYASEPDDVQ